MNDAVSPSASAPSVLIVEDSPTQALQLSHLLEGAGMVVTHVGSGHSAIERLNESLPDLVITDFHLPNMSGDELCRRIRMHAQARGLPILMMTSEIGAGAELHGLESGADDYVSKSVSDEVLLLRVHALLRKSVGGGSLSESGRRLGKTRLLVVEDSPTYRQLLGATLEWEGHLIRAVDTAGAALGALEAEEFDGVLLDIVLPDMDGIELCRRIVARHAGAANAPAIVVLTGQESQEFVNAAFEAGADEVVGKSRELAVIKARLRALLRRKSVHEEQMRATATTVARELELAQAHAEKEAAEAKAALAERLEQANRELKQTQAQLVQSAKMASLGQLVAGIAHEINNPSAFVIAHLQTVRRLCEEVGAEVEVSLTADAAKKLAKIRQRMKDMEEGLERVRGLVVKLRTFSRLDEGEFKQASVRENVEAVLTMLRHRTKGRIEVDCRFGEPDFIACYPGLLNQALMNVVSNAIDAIEGQGRIEITSGAMNGGYEIGVRDSGCGIPATVREHIFDPFFTTKPVGQGTGLGMSITYQIVQKHGGSIEIDSQEGEGTHIAIRLPAIVLQDAPAKQA